MNYGKCIMWYHIIGLAFSVPTFSWIRLACMLKNITDTMKISSKFVLLRSFPHISISTPWPTKHNNAYKQQDGFYFTRQFYLLLSTHISKTSNIYKPEKFLSLASQTICDHMISDPKLDHTFHVFWIRNWIINVFFLFMSIVHLLQRQEGVGIHCKLIHYWIELNPAIILFTAQYRN